LTASTPPPHPQVPHPTPAAAAAKTGIPARTYLLAGCSIGGTLCATLAANSGVNLPFAIASAVFGGIIVLVTAAPGVAAAAAAAAPAAVMPMDGSMAQVPAAARLKPSGTGAVGIGMSAAVLSFIMSQIAQFAVGYTLYGVNGELTNDQVFSVSDILGTSITIIRVPFEILIGAYLVSRARNIFAALATFAVAYFVIYLIEQTVSAAFGMSGLWRTWQSGGFEAVAWGFGWVLGIPLVAQGIGAVGAVITNWLSRRKA
jgi:hypothetical protein